MSVAAIPSGVVIEMGFLFESRDATEEPQACDGVADGGQCA